MSGDFIVCRHPADAPGDPSKPLWAIIDNPVVEQNLDIAITALRELRAMKPGLIMLGVIDKALAAVGESK